MKKYVLLVLLVCYAVLSVEAQTNIKYTLIVRDNKGEALANTEVEFKEVRTKQKINLRTNESGVITHTLTWGEDWQINVGEIIDNPEWQFSVKKGATGTRNMAITYDYDDYKRIMRSPIDRTELALKTVQQNFSEAQKPTPQENILLIEIKRANKSGRLANFPVAMTCYALQKTYQAITNDRGIAVFKLPIQQEYELDIDGIDSFDYFDMPDKGNMTYTKIITYEPTKVGEIVRNDTITQNLTPNMQSTSGRSLVTLKVKGGEDGKVNDLPVYLNSTKSTKVYLGKTNADGEAKFLLPRGDAYMISFRYEKNIDVFNLRKKKGIHHANKTVIYRPQPELRYPEEFLPTLEDLKLNTLSDLMETHYPKPKQGEIMLPFAKFQNQINEKSTQAVMEVGFAAEAYSAEANSDYKPLNLAVVVDKSGSMEADKGIYNARKAIKDIVRILRPQDVLSIVAFDDDGFILHQAGTVQDKTKLLESIDRIDADNGTISWSGLSKGFEQVKKNMGKNHLSKVIFISDGYDYEAPKSLFEKIKKANVLGEQCELIVVGANHTCNRAMLRLMAELTTHQEPIILAKSPNSNEQATNFNTYLQSMLLPIAEDVTIEIHYHKKLLFSQLYGLPLKEKSNGKVVIKLPRIYAGMADRFAFVKFTLPNSIQSIEDEPIRIVTKYFDLRTQKEVRKETLVKLEWSAANGLLEYQIEADRKATYAIAQMNWALKVMADAVATKDYPKAKEALVATDAEIKKLFPEASNKKVLEVLSQIAKYVTIINYTIINKSSKSTK